MEKLILLCNLIVGAYLTGLIWTIQVVHYPLFSYAERANFSAFEAEHSLRISSIVLLPMLAELVLSGLFLTVRLEGIPALVPWVCAGLVGLIWLSTFFVQVPQHNILASGFEQSAHTLLVSSNWIRTLAWSAKTLLLGFSVYTQL
ncbi:MAG: hypothetical protein ACK41E_11570 [Deinococcales bacterium]